MPCFHRTGLKIKVYSGQHISLSVIFNTHNNQILCNFFLLNFIDITNGEVLQKITQTIGWNVDVQDIIAKSGTVLLMKNTEDALENGAFGVPR